MSMQKWTDEQLQQFLEEIGASTRTKDGHTVTVGVNNGNYMLSFGTSDVELTQEQSVFFKACEQRLFPVNPPSIRDTQFAGFAQAVFEETQKMACSYRTYPGYDALKQQEIEILARRAYDLAVHVVSEQRIVHMSTAKLLVSDVPDMTELPKETE